MFFDPGTKTETKTDPLSLESLIAWLEKQPADKTYCYYSHGHCMYAQYFTSMGFRDVLAGGVTIFHSGGSFQLPHPWCDLPISAENTFGAALERARKLAG